MNGDFEPLRFAAASELILKLEKRLALLKRLMYLEERVKYLFVLKRLVLYFSCVVSRDLFGVHQIITYSSTGFSFYLFTKHLSA